jgi:hypothetical protein
VPSTAADGGKSPVTASRAASARTRSSVAPGVNVGPPGTAGQPPFASMARYSASAALKRSYRKTRGITRAANSRNDGESMASWIVSAGSPRSSSLLKFQLPSSAVASTLPNRK